MQPPWLIGYVFPAIGDVEGQARRFTEIANELGKPIQIITEADKISRKTVIDHIKARSEPGPDIVVSFLPYVTIRNDALIDIVLLVQELSIVSRSIPLSKLLCELKISTVEAASVHPLIRQADFRNVVADNIGVNRVKIISSVNSKNAEKMEASAPQASALVEDLLNVLRNDGATSIDSAVAFLIQRGSDRHKKRDAFRKEVDRAIDNLFVRPEVDALIKENLSRFRRHPAAGSSP